MIQQTLIFTKAQIVNTVIQLEERLDNIQEELEWVDSAEEAVPYEREKRLIRATLAAIYADYGDQYFEDARAEAIKGNHHG